MDREAFGGENAESYYDEGLTASMKGDLERAIECFGIAVRMDQKMAAAYHQLGKCYSRLGQQEKAISLLTQVVTKRPKLAAARIDLGTALTAHGELAQAKAEFKTVLLTKPEDAKALLGLATVEFAEANWPAALQLAESALQNSGATYPVMYMIGRCTKLLGDEPTSRRALSKATDIIEKYTESNESKPEGHYLRGELAFLQEEYVAALEAYRRAEDRIETGRSYSAYGENFGLVDALARQAQCYERMERPERARELVLRIRDMAPDHIVVRAMLIEGSEDNGSGE